MRNPGGNAAEEALLGILLSTPEYISKIKSGAIGLTADDFVTDLNRRVFTAMIETDGDFDVGTLNESFTQDEVSRVIQMQVRRMELANTEQALTECIDKLLTQVPEGRLLSLRENLLPCSFEAGITTLLEALR